MKTSKYIGGVVSVAILAMAMTSVADSMGANYGDFTAKSVDFIQVQESTTNTGDTVPKYGAPIVTTASDAMDFNPVGFSAQASNGDSDLTDGNLVFEVHSHEDRVIEEIAFAERGTFSLGGTGTDATYASISAYFYVEVTEVDGNSIGPIGIDAWMDFKPVSNSDGMFELATDGAGPGAWSGSVSIDLNQFLFDSGWGEEARATKVSVDLNNWLAVYTEDGTSAMIAKKDFDVGMSVEIVPEPASLALLVGASAMLGFIRKRFIV